MTAEALRELLADLEREIEEVRRTLLRYEREIDPDSAYVLSDYLDALRLDARDAAARGDADGVRAAQDDVRQLLRDTDGRLDQDAR